MAREVHAPPSSRSRARPQPTEPSPAAEEGAGEQSKRGLKTIINLSGELRRTLSCARCPSALYTHCVSHACHVRVLRPRSPLTHCALAVAAGACTCTGSEGVPCTGLYL
eukprot:4241496-Prymnesium_polylepis.1